MSHSARRNVSKENLLIKLPPELRNKIYSLVVIDSPLDERPSLDNPYPIHLGGTWGGGMSEQSRSYQTPHRMYRPRARAAHHAIFPRRERPETWCQPPFLQVSRQIRHEALDIYLFSNTFELNVNVKHLPPFSDWLKRYHNVCGTKKLFECVALDHIIVSGENEPYFWFCMTKLIFELASAMDYEDENCECQQWFKLLNNGVALEWVLPRALIELAVHAAHQPVPFKDVYAPFQDLAYAAIIEKKHGPDEVVDDGVKAYTWLQVHQAMKRMDSDVAPRTLTLKDFDLTPRAAPQDQELRAIL